MGISLKRFSGWEPTETHDHEHDEQGRLIRTTVTREPEWDDDEQAWMLALLLYRSQLGPCGHYLPESTAANAEDRYDVGEPIRCHACTAVAVASAAAAGNPHPSALLFQPVRR